MAPCCVHHGMAAGINDAGLSVMGQIFRRQRTRFRYLRRAWPDPAEVAFLIRYLRAPRPPMVLEKDAASMDASVPNLAFFPRARKTRVRSSARSVKSRNRSRGPSAEQAVSLRPSRYAEKDGRARARLRTGETASRRPAARRSRPPEPSAARSRPLHTVTVTTTSPSR